MIPVVLFIALLTAPTTAQSSDQVGGDVSGFTAGQAQVLLDSHNFYRGAEDAANMIKLVWDPALAASAQKASEACSYGHTQFGENIYATRRGVFDTTLPVELWAAEKDYYDYDTKKCQAGKMCGHYTQVVWAETSAIGCGISKCDFISNFNNPGYLVFCHYGPSGNWWGEDPFAKGSKCSACPSNAPNCDAEYNLCSA